MSVFGMKTEGDNQNQNKTKSITTKGNNSAEGEGSTKKRRFGVVETGDLDALVADSLAKKTKQATQSAVSVFTGRSQLRFKGWFSLAHKHKHKHTHKHSHKQMRKPTT